MVKLKGKKFVNGAAAHAPETRAAIKTLADKTFSHAKRNLEQARASTQWHKIIGPDGETKVTMEDAEGKYKSLDYFITLHNDDAMALDFGHKPSGVFGPDGSRGHIKTKSPGGLFILWRAAIPGSPS